MESVTITNKSVNSPFGLIHCYEASVATRDGAITASDRTPLGAITLLRAKLEVLLLVRRLGLAPAEGVEQDADAALERLRDYSRTAETFLLGD